MKAHFLKLARYNTWANQRVLTSLQNQNGSAECIGKLSHIFLAESVWQTRLNGNSPAVNIFETLPLEQLAELEKENSEGWRKLIENLSDFEEVIHYKMLNGTETKSTVADILTHIFNHGTYHRAQIATLLRQEGMVPASSDYISFSRG